MHKALVITLTVVLLFTLLPVVANAQGTQVSDSDSALLEQELVNLDTTFGDLQSEMGQIMERFYSRVASLSKRVTILEEEDVGSFKKRVLELERSISGLSVQLDNNNSKLETFDDQIAGLISDVKANRDSVLTSEGLVNEQETRVSKLEDQLNNLQLISAFGLIAGVGAVVWVIMQQ